MSTSRESRLKQRLQETRRQLRKARQEHDELAAASEELLSEHEELKAKSPEDVVKERDQLKSEKAEAAHKSAFSAAATKAGIPADRHDALYKLSGHQAEGDPDPAKIATTVKATVKANSWIKGAPKPGDEEEAEDGDQGDGDGDAQDEDALAAAELSGKKPAKGDKAPKKEKEKEAPLPPGEGSARGPRHPSKSPSVQEKVDQDFAATGRTDAFKL